MYELHPEHITVDPVSIPESRAAEVALFVLRLDKIHPLVSGNKWFKLRYYLEEAGMLGKKRIVTFGGAWSNHILATASACRLYGFQSTGIIRGERPPRLSANLQQAAETGMDMVFISREDFAKEKIPGELIATENYFIKPGGYGIPGALGAAGILDYCDKKMFTHIACATGTGTMMAGLAMAALPRQVLVGISALKNNLRLEEDVKRLAGNDIPALHFIHDYHFGGFARHRPGLIAFMNDWHRQTGIPTDFVYTAKLCYAVADLCTKNFFHPGSKVLLIHSGGLTGNASLKKGTLIF